MARKRLDDETRLQFSPRSRHDYVTRSEKISSVVRGFRNLCDELVGWRAAIHDPRQHNGQMSRPMLSLVLRLALFLAFLFDATTVSLDGAVFTENWSDDFESGTLSQRHWISVPTSPSNRIQIEKRGNGHALHITAASGNATVETRARIEDAPYTLTFSFRQPSRENAGYAGVVRHIGAPSDAYWWLEWQPPKLRVWTVYKGRWAVRWETSGIACDQLYRVVVEHKRGVARFTIQTTEGKTVAVSGPVRHDHGTEGPILFGAHAGGGARGILIDDVTLEYTPPPSPLSLGADYKKNASRMTLARDGIRAEFSTDRAWPLSLSRSNGRDVFCDGFARLIMEDMTSGRMYGDSDFTAVSQPRITGDDKLSARLISGDSRVRMQVTYALEKSALVWTVKLSGDFDKPHGARARFVFPFPRECDEIFMPSAGAPFTRKTLRPCYAYRDPTTGVCIPLATLYSKKNVDAFSIFLDPETPKSRAAFLFDPDGRSPTVQARWSCLRLERGDERVLRLFVALHPSHEYAGLKWTRDQFPACFASAAATPPGHQVISGQIPDDRVKALRAMGFTWEETHLIHVPWYGRYISSDTTQDEITQANEYLKRIRQRDFHLFIYWNFVETPPKFAEESFPDSISRDAAGIPHLLGWKRECVWMIPYTGGTWRRYIVRQLDTLLKTFPGVSGAFADNTLHSAISYGQDDGYTFVNGRAACQFALTQHAILKEAKQRLRAAGRALWANQACDLESAMFMDGILVEGSRGLECQQYFGLRKPMVLITYYNRNDPNRSKRLTQNLRAALRCGVMLGFNEWEIAQGMIDRDLLKSYLPLFEPLRGREWLLTPYRLRIPSDLSGRLYRTRKGNLYFLLIRKTDGVSKDVSFRLDAPSLDDFVHASCYDPGNSTWRPVENLEHTKTGIQARLPAFRSVCGVLLKRK